MKQPTAQKKTTLQRTFPSGPACIRAGADRVVRPVHQGGFTLVELVIIIVLIGILAVVAIPSFDYTNTQAAAATRKLIEDLRYAQNLAVSTQIRHGLVFSNISTVCSDPNSVCAQYQVTQFDHNWNPAQFDATGHSLTQCYQNDTNQVLVDCQQVLDPLTGQPMIVQMTGVTQGVTLGTTLNGLTIQFDASGKPWAGQGGQHVPLQSSSLPAQSYPVPNNTLTIQAGTCSASLTITVTTGLVASPAVIPGTTAPMVTCS